MTYADAIPRQQHDCRTSETLTSDTPPAPSPWADPTVKAALANGGVIHSKPEPLTTALEAATPVIGGTKGNGKRTLDTATQGQHGLKPCHISKIEQTSGDKYGGYDGLDVYRLFCPESKRTSQVLVAESVTVTDALEDLGLLPLERQRPYDVNWTVDLCWRDSKMHAVKCVINKEDDMSKKTQQADYVPPSQATPIEAAAALVNDVKQTAARNAEQRALVAAKPPEPAGAKAATEWDTFDKANGHKPIAERSHDLLRAPHEMSEHLKKIYNYSGQHVRAMFASTLDQALEKMGIDKVWAEIYAYEDEHPSDKSVDEAPVSAVETVTGAALGATTAAATTGGQTPDISRVEPPMPSKDDKPVQAETTTVEKTPLPEAPFSANFHMVEPHGVEVQLTVRTDTVAEGVKQVEFTIEHLLKAGWTSTRHDAMQSAPATAGNGASAPAPAANEGLSPCIMLKIGKTFKGDKEQILFECPDVADDVKYSSKDIGKMVQIVSGLHKLDGTALTAGDLVNGNKIAVSGKVSWKRDGNYVNVLGTAA